MNEVQLFAIDIGGTLIAPKTGSWYITAPVQEWLMRHPCEEDEIDAAITHARRRNQCILARTIEDEIEINKSFYQSFFDMLSSGRMVSSEEILEFSRHRAEAEDLYSVDESAIEALERAGQQVRLALFSNTWPSVVRFLDQRGILHLFELKLFSCDFGLKKPDPRFFELLISESRLAPQKICLFDDSSIIIAAAHLQGLRGRRVTFHSLADSVNNVLSK